LDSDWLRHPKFVPIRDSVLDCLKAKEYIFRKIGRVLFLCGGQNSPRRDQLAEYFRLNHSESSILFYAEDVWDIIAHHNPSRNALEVEAQLAELADAIIIVVESPGTFAEIGAFANSEPLRKKLLPILDEAKIGEKSFLKTGPITWIDKESLFAPSIWTCFELDRILDAVKQIEDRLERIRVKKRTLLHNLLDSRKHLVFFVCDLVSIFGPCPIDHVNHYIHHVLGNTVSIDLPFLLGLNKGMGLLESFLIDGREMFYRPLKDGRIVTFHVAKKNINIPTLRTIVISSMLSCGPAQRALEQMEAEHGTR